MPARLRAIVLLFAMLLATLGPTASVWAHGESAMGCCAGTDECAGLALKQACCPCAPVTPVDPPASTSIVGAAPPAVLTASWSSLAAGHPGPILAGAGRALWVVMAQAAPNPPWLLHGVFLI